MSPLPAEQYGPGPCSSGNLCVEPVRDSRLHYTRRTTEVVNRNGVESRIVRRPVKRFPYFRLRGNDGRVGLVVSL
jgi:hypothetical protein